MDTELQDLSKSQSESFNDLPAALKEGIDALDDFDILSPSLAGSQFSKQEGSIQQVLSLPSLPNKVQSIYIRKRTSDLEQITEEESFQPDASDITDMRSNDFIGRLSYSEFQNTGNMILSIDQDQEFGNLLKTEYKLARQEPRLLCVSTQVSSKCLHAPYEPASLLSDEKRSGENFKFESQISEKEKEDITEAHINLTLSNQLTDNSNLNCNEFKKPSFFSSFIKESIRPSLSTKNKLPNLEIERPLSTINTIFKKKNFPISNNLVNSNIKANSKLESGSLSQFKANQFKNAKFQSPKTRKPIQIKNGSEGIDPRSTIFFNDKDQSRPSSSTCLANRDTIEMIPKFYQKTYFSNQVNMSKSSFQGNQNVEKCKRQADFKDNMTLENSFNPEVKSIFDKVFNVRSSQPNSKDEHIFESLQRPLDHCTNSNNDFATNK
jgi:hypothetical protein